jgi:hypothetical protein
MVIFSMSDQEMAEFLVAECGQQGVPWWISGAMIESYWMSLRSLRFVFPGLNSCLMEIHQL